MHKLLVEKVDEYDNFPLMVQLGFIHAIPEDDFDIASATIMDISFLGLFPKEIFQAMHKYGYKYEKSNQSEEIQGFYSLVDALITAFVYWPITLQKVIHILIAKRKAEIDLTDNEQDSTHISSNQTIRLVSSSLSPSLNRNSQLNDYPVQKKTQVLCQQMSYSTCYRNYLSPNVLPNWA
jgi:hypothetical protein